MCDYEVDDPVQAFRKIERTARKSHKCTVCKSTIGKGTKYRYTSWVFDGTAGDTKMCEPCTAAFDLFGHEHHSYPMPDGFHSAVRECHVGQKKSNPSARVWRAVEAGILKRRRIAKRAVSP